MLYIFFLFQFSHWSCNYLTKFYFWWNTIVKLMEIWNSMKSEIIKINIFYQKGCLILDIKWDSTKHFSYDCLKKNLTFGLHGTTLNIQLNIKFNSLFQFLVYGFLQCLDAFLFYFTFLPVRIVLAFLKILTHPCGVLIPRFAVLSVVHVQSFDSSIDKI